ncbi:HAMP domain-containing sensor histidine kinase [Chryseolinea sp. T2]|uniref:sensor histidine kinase n=1 Tax=Chryseolinea sp. T2 TaxID=3129255 RepID=UPI003077CF30
MGRNVALLFFCSLVGSATSLLAQETSMIQIKAFDQQMNAASNLSISINDGDFIPLADKKATFYEVPKSSLPPKSIRLSKQEWEVESWNFSKGTLEIIIRPKPYQIIKLAVQTANKRPLAGVAIEYFGRKNVKLTTDAAGSIELPIALDEQLTSNAQFAIEGYKVTRLISSSTGKVLLVEPQKQPGKRDGIAPSGTFNTASLDSIESLTVFYSMLKAQNMSDLDEATRKRIDERFHELIGELQPRTRQNEFVSRISDSSFVKNDVENLLEQAKFESSMMDEFRQEFDDKIQVINKKLTGGTSALSATERENLLNDLGTLEEVLRRNEDKFYKNISDYRIILRSLKASFSDIKDLQDKLSASEIRRLEEQQEFRTKILLAVTTLTLFGALLIWSMLLRNRVMTQKKSLVRANDEIQRINENLEVLVFERSRQLVEAYKEMDIFLYRASHDLRAPICTIIGLCNLAMHDANGDDELVNKISNTAIKMDGLLKKLKMISEVNQPSNYSPVLLPAMIKKICNVFSRSITEHNIEVLVDNDASVHFYSYPDLIEIILYNLIENALFFSTLTRGRRPKIQVMASVEENNLFLSVYDNGVGIDDETRIKLWTMFFVGHEHSKGNGLGLYIVMKSVQTLNGKIDVETVAGSFTRFSVTIPINSKVTSAINRLNNTRELEALPA